jgi:hypothetical protein
MLFQVLECSVVGGFVNGVLTGTQDEHDRGIDGEDVWS